MSMIQTPINILLNISEIAIITGDNPYKSKREYVIDFWKKNAKDDFENYKKITEFIKETDEEIINKITLKNNINIANDLNQCVKTNNTNDLNNMRKNIMTKMDNLSEEDKKIITKSITNVTNTKFGIRNENDITKLYENMTGNIIIKDDKYCKIKIFESKLVNVFIGGKIDGINKDNGYIIEVKNRVNKLFYSLRDYEKVQIMCYMYLFKSQNGHLVEAHKKKDVTDINIIEVAFDEYYMNTILSKITLFVNFYCNFIIDHDAKINILKNKDEIQFI